MVLVLVVVFVFEVEISAGEGEGGIVWGFGHDCFHLRRKNSLEDKTQRILLCCLVLSLGGYD